MSAPVPVWTAAAAPRASPSAELLFLSERERIHFAHIGLGLEDVAWGAVVFQQTQQRSLGQRLELWHARLWV